MQSGCKRHTFCAYTSVIAQYRAFRKIPVVSFHQEITHRSSRRKREIFCGATGPHVRLNGGANFFLKKPIINPFKPTVMAINIKSPERKQTAGNAQNNANLSVQTSKRPSKAPFSGCFFGKLQRRGHIAVTESVHCFFAFCILQNLWW